MTDEEKKQKKKEYDHERYMRKRQEVLNKCHRYHQEHLESRRAHNREYNRNHKEERKKYNHEFNQEKNAPYHKIMDEAGIKRQCENCGTTESLCTHHKDLNHNNNELSNLQWLCLSCHAKLHQNLEREKRNAKYQVFI